MYRKVCGHPSQHFWCSSANFVNTNLNLKRLEVFVWITKSSNLLKAHKNKHFRTELLKLVEQRILHSNSANHTGIPGGCLLNRMLGVNLAKDSVKCVPSRLQSCWENLNTHPCPKLYVQSWHPLQLFSLIVQTWEDMSLAGMGTCISARTNNRRCSTAQCRSAPRKGGHYDNCLFYKFLSQAVHVLQLFCDQGFEEIFKQFGSILNRNQCICRWNLVQQSSKCFGTLDSHA